MTGRVLGVVLQAVIGTVLTVVLAGLYFMLILGMGPSEAFLDQAIRLVLALVPGGRSPWGALLVLAGCIAAGILIAARTPAEQAVR